MASIIEDCTTTLILALCIFLATTFSSSRFSIKERMANDTVDQMDRSRSSTTRTSMVTETVFQIPQQQENSLFLKFYISLIFHDPTFDIYTKLSVLWKSFPVLAVPVLAGTFPAWSAFWAVLCYLTSAWEVFSLRKTGHGESLAVSDSLSMYWRIQRFCGLEDTPRIQNLNNQLRVTCLRRVRHSCSFFSDDLSLSALDVETK